MQDQDQLPEVHSNDKKLNLFRDWWEEMYPRDFFLTFKNYFFNHKAFFDEVFSEQWDNKVKPMAFLFTAIGVSLIIGAISPWGLDFSDEPAQPKAWRAIIDTLDEEETLEFVEAFGLTELYMASANDVEYNVAVDKRVMEATGHSETPSARQIQTYFENETDYKLLAAKAEIVALDNQVAHDKYLKDSELSEIDQVIMLNLFVFYCMLYWLIAHYFFKKTDRTSRETVFVFMYGLGMLIFFVYVPFIAISGTDNSTVTGIGFFAVVAMFLIILYRIFSIFKHTHNTGFLGLIMVYIKTFLTSLLLGLPLLFVINKRKSRKIKNA